MSLKTNKIKVLLVEDDEEDYIITRELLSESKNLKFELKWDHSYTDALNSVTINNFDIVLVDYRLGERDGLELLKEIMAIDPSIPVILLTGAGDDEIDIQAMRSGASDYLVKGQIDSVLLERAIRYSIERKKVEREIIKLNEELELRVAQRTKELEVINRELQKEVTERKLAQEQIYNLAYYDSLTKLPNREMLNIRLKQAFEDAKRTNKNVAVMFIDLDGFKSINDTLGHLAGDEILINVGNLLKECVRESDVVCRHGGDEFIIVLTNLSDIRDVELVAQKIIQKLSTPLKIASSEAKVTPSIGISIYPVHSKKSDRLIKLADKAMYYIKQNGKNSYHFFSAKIKV